MYYLSVTIFKILLYLNNKNYSHRERYVKLGKASFKFNCNMFVRYNFLIISLTDRNLLAKFSYLKTPD